jgi:arabinogalactan oligomer / maltooligosaccharide transport system substrate-binding protein
MRGKRIPFILGSLLAIMALGLGACGNAPTTTGGSSVNYKGTIVIWHSWDGAYLAEKQYIFNQYHLLHPDVNIQLVKQDNIIDKSVTAENAGQGPDIIAWVDDSLGKLAASHIVVPMDQYISKDYVESTYNRAAAQAVEYNGHVYGVPESVEAITMLYNKDLISADQLPKTADDLLTFEQTYQQAHPGSYGVVWNTLDAYFDAPWFYGYGAYYVHSDGSVGLNTPQALGAAKFIASLRQYLPKQIDYATADSLFKEGKAAAIVNGPWSYADYQKAGIKLGFMTLPTVTENNNAPASPFVGVKSLWVTKTAANPALCADLLKFYTNESNQIAMAKVNGEIPANLAADNDAGVQALASVGGFAAQAKVGVPLPNTPYMSALWKPVADALTAIWSGSQTPDAAMAAAQQAAQAGVQGIQS